MVLILLEIPLFNFDAMRVVDWDYTHQRARLETSQAEFAAQGQACAYVLAQFDYPTALINFRSKQNA